MATHDTQNVSYMRKDQHFLADGVWYISTPCPVHGLVDEAVLWADAKTPHHAGVIADGRHASCHAVANDEANREDARQQVEAARAQLREYERLAREYPDKYDRSVVEQCQRVKDIEQANGWAL